MADSLLKGLKARRDAIAVDNFKDIPVPLVPDLYLRIRTLDHEFLEKQRRRLDKASTGARAAVEINVNAAIIGAATSEVLIGIGDDQESYDLLGPEIREEFSLDERASAAEAVRALLLRDGDVVTLAAAVMDHSGYSVRAIDEALAGE